MSQENVEIVRRAVEVLQAGMERGDLGAAFDAGLYAPDAGLIAPDAEWITPQFEGKRRVWRGREGAMEFMRTWTEEFENWSMRVERLIDAGGDRVVVLAHQTATGKASGVPVELASGHIYELKDGRVIRATFYGSHADTLHAAGLSE